MRLIGFECRKLTKQLHIWLFTGLLLTGNLFMLYASQRSTPAYFFIFQQKDSYAAFCQGDKGADAMGFYQQELDAQEGYLASYRQFINEMESRAAKMRETVFYRDENSYVFRNLQKTCEDFSVFADTAVTADNCFGLRAFAEYDYGILFLLIFLGLVTWYVLFYERNRNLLLLLKGCRQGHCPLAFAKLITLLLSGAFYVLIQETGAILCFGWMYGYGDLSRPVQSVSLFRNCSYVLTAGQAMGVTLLIRIGIALLMGALMFGVGMCIKSEMGAVFVIGILLGVLYGFNRLLYPAGSMNALKFVNPFCYWSMKQALGYYLNLNFFGYAVGKDFCAVIVLGFFTILLSLLGIVIFHRTCQIKRDGYWERWMQWLRGKWGGISRRSSLLYYEFYKLLFQQKKWLAVVLLLIWTACSTAGIYAPQYYASAKEASYHAYLGELAGPVTDETLVYLKQEEARFLQLKEQIRSYGEDISGADAMNRQLLQFEIDLKEEGFLQVQSQLEALAQKPGRLNEKYLLDEAAYLKLWQDTDKEVLLWLGGSIFLLFLICGIYAASEGSQMRILLRSTRKGRRALRRSKDAAALLCTITVYLAAEAPLFLAYARIDGFSTAGQKLCDLVNVSCCSAVTLFMFEGTVFFLKAVSFLLAAWMGRSLARRLSQKTVAFLLGSGLLAVAALIFSRFGWSLHMLLLRLL